MSAIRKGTERKKENSTPSIRKLALVDPDLLTGLLRTAQKQPNKALPSSTKRKGRKRRKTQNINNKKKEEEWSPTGPIPAGRGSGPSSGGEDHQAEEEIGRGLVITTHPKGHHSGGEEVQGSKTTDRTDSWTSKTPASWVLIAPCHVPSGGRWEGGRWGRGRTWRRHHCPGHRGLTKKCNNQGPGPIKYNFKEPHQATGVGPHYQKSHHKGRPCAREQHTGLGRPRDPW